MFAGLASFAAAVLIGASAMVMSEYGNPAYSEPPPERLDEAEQPIVSVADTPAVRGAATVVSYRPAECRRMVPQMWDKVDEAQDRFDKAKAAASDAISFLNRVRDEAIRGSTDSSVIDAALVATLTLNTVGKTVVDIMKLNPVNCAAVEAASGSAKVFLDVVEKADLYKDIVIPTINQGLEGRERPDRETLEALNLAAGGMVFGCAIPAGAAIIAGYNLGKNVAEISDAVTDGLNDRNARLHHIRSLEPYLRQHQARLIKTGRRLQEVAAAQRSLEASCASASLIAKSPTEPRKTAEATDRGDTPEKSDFREALERTEQCTQKDDIPCARNAVQDAWKAAKNSAEKSAAFNAEKRLDRRQAELLAAQTVRELPSKTERPEQRPGSSQATAATKAPSLKDERWRWQQFNNNDGKPPRESEDGIRSGDAIHRSQAEVEKLLVGTTGSTLTGFFGCGACGVGSTITITIDSIGNSAASDVLHSKNVYTRLK